MADAIKALADVLADATASITRQRDDAIKNWQHWQARALAAEARCERLEGALREIERAPAWGYPERWETTPSEVRQLARAIVAELPPPVDPDLVEAREICVAVAGADPETSGYTAGRLDGSLSLRCALAALRRDQWQTMDSAPRDGTDIDVWFQPITNGVKLLPCRVPNAFFEDGHWYDQRGIRLWQEPSHWMPLPTPPILGGRE